MEKKPTKHDLLSDDTTARRAVAETMRRINQAWLDGQPDDLAPLIHPAMAMVYPGFAGRGEGRNTIVAGFVDFCSNARVHSYREGDSQIDVAGETAVMSYNFEMRYERSGEKYLATGRDLWVFTRLEGQWLGAWRTMFDIVEKPA